MDFSFRSVSDNQSESIFLREGIPTEWEIVQNEEYNIFGNQLFTFDANNKIQGKKTGDMSDEEANDFMQYEDDPNSISFAEIGELEQIIENCAIQKGVTIVIKSEKKKHNKTVVLRKKKSTIKKCNKRKFSSKKNKCKTDVSSQTKNIPKNYGKQIIKFIKKDKNSVVKVLEGINSLFNYEQLLNEIKKKKKTISKISDLRKLWMSFQFSKQMRILTGIFLRKHSLSWIFNSRIENIKNPIKYRYRIEEGVKKPADFIYLKDF